MYCSACGSPIAPGLSFCNRCGMSLKERGGSKPAGINGLVTAMVIVGAAAMGMMLGGPIALKKEGQFVDEFIVLFMFLTFLIGLLTEVFLYRQLTRLTSDTSKTEHVALPPQSVALPPQSVTPEYRSPQPQRLPEPLPSVTENTTRTLEHSREERRK